jgi:hypothetical protein
MVTAYSRPDPAAAKHPVDSMLEKYERPSAAAPDAVDRMLAQFESERALEHSQVSYGSVDYDTFGIDGAGTATPLAARQARPQPGHLGARPAPLEHSAVSLATTIRCVVLRIGVRGGEC